MNRRLILMAMAAGAMLGAYGKSFTLDLRGPGTGGAKVRLAASSQTQGDGTLRSFDLGAGVADVGEVAVGDELTFALFDDVALVLTLKEKMPSPLGGDAFLAEVAGYEGIRSAVVLRTSDGLTIDVQDFLKDRVYKVMSTPSGVKVREIKPLRGGRCGCDTLSPAALGGMQPAASESVEGSSTGARGPSRRLMSPMATDTCVDVLVAYDKNAATWAKSDGGGLTNFAQTAVQKMNYALANTGLDEKFRFRLVGIVSVSASTDNLNTALNAATGGTSGWGAIKAKRDEVGADIVTVLIDTGSAYGTTGLGWSLMTTDFASFSENAYNVCAIRSVAQSHTMTHEVGHNMGCGHSKEQETDPGPQLYDYSSGYYLSADGGKYHTIMAYGTEGPGGDEIPYFSSPNHQYRGVTVGDSSHDNTRTLVNTFAGVSAWREAHDGEIGDEPGEEDMNKPLEWVTTRDEAFAMAREKGKNVFLVSGRDTCANTMGTRNYSCEVPDVKWYLLRDYVCWYNNCDTQYYEDSRYFSGYDVGGTLPFIAVIDVANDKTLAAEGGYHSASDLRMMLGRVAKDVKFSPESGTRFEESVQISMSANPGAVIYYTLDGTIPDEMSTRYEKPITLTSTVTICAVAVVGGKAGLPSSADFIRSRTEGLGGYEWTVHVLGEGCVIKSVEPDPTGDVEVPARIGGFAVTGIDEAIFQGNISITSVSIPATLEAISPFQFYGCRRLAAINVDAGNGNYASVDGIVYDSARETLVCCPPGVKYLEVPGWVKNIGSDACPESENLEAVLFPEGLETIGYEAFYSCSRLSCVVIPESVKSIGWDAFSYCEQLTDAWVPEHLEYVDLGYDSFYLKAGVALHYYSGSSTLVAVHLDPNGGELGIGDWKIAFAEGTVVDALPRPHRTGYGFTGWFTEKDGGVAVTMLDRVAVGTTFYAHWDAVNYEWQYEENDYGGITITGVSPINSHMIIPSQIDGKEVTAIRYGAFADNGDLVSVTIPSSVVYIGYAAFWGCSSLETVVFEGDEDDIYIEEDAFAYTPYEASIPFELIVEDGVLTGFKGPCPSQITLPDSVRSIDDEVFYLSNHPSASGITSVNFNEGLETIGSFAFFNCYNLSEIVMPSTVKEIGADAFGACWNLRSVTLNEGLETIEYNAFYGCPLKEVTLPTTIKDVTINAFGNPDEEEYIRVNAPWSLWGKLDSGKVGKTTIDVVFYGEKPNFYTVTFNVNGGNALSEEKRTVMAGSPVGSLPIPTKAGADTFAGWFTAIAGGDMVDEKTIVTGDMMLYARWEELNDTYAKARGIGGMGGRVYGTNRGASVTAGEFLKNEYGSDHTVWFKWTAPSSGLLRLEITDADFDTVLGVFTGGSASSLTRVADDDDGGGDGGLSAASLDVAAGVSYYIVVGGYESEAGDFFLDWEFFDESNLVSVRFDAAGGAVKPDNMRCMPGTAIGTLPWPERQYHRFEGWFTSPVGGDAVYQSWIVPEGGTTLYAHWTELLHWHTDSASAFAEAKSTGRLIFFLGGRETCGNTIGTRDYTCEEPEVRAALGEYVLWFCNCDTQGQDFWRYASGSGSVELPYVCVINPYTNVSLVSSQGYLNAEDVFALLAAAGPAPGLRTVVFDANGGKVDEPERTVQPGGAVGALPVPTREKYKFLGWFTAAEGGAKVAATTKVSEDVTYYAHWEYDGSAMVTVKIAEGCEAMGKVSGGNATFKAGDKVSLKATANSGCVFVGWRVGDGAVASQVASWSYVATGEPVTIMALFATAEDDAASLKVAVEDQMVGSDGTLSYDIGACVESLTPAKLAVSGLPTGLKFDSKTTVISGQATKPGVYTVKVTATNTSSKKGIEKTFEIKVPNLLPELFKEAGLEDSYRCWGGVAPESLSGVISNVKAGGWKLALSGLPSGLKYDDAKGTIAGVATKEMSCTVYFTATKDKEKQVATATFEVVFPTLTLKMEAHDGGGAKGKVSGDGAYPKGKKVTLKATPDSGCVFVGWREEGSTDFLSQAASYSYEMPGDDVTFVAVFATTKQDAANVKLSVNGAAMSSTSGGKPATTNILCGVAVNWPLAVTALSATTVKVAGLPAGMKFADKPVTSKVGSGKTAVVVTNVPANTIYGAPTAASKVDAKKGVVPSDVKVTVTTAGKTVVTYAMSVTVDPLPAWAVGNFEGAAGNGAATMSVTAAGKVSGKVSLAGTNWTFKADSYAAAESAVAQTNFVVVAEAVSGKATMPVELSLSCTALDYLPGSATACAEGAFGGSAARLYRLVWADKGDAVAAGQVATYAGAYSFTAAYGSKTGDVAFTLDEKGVAKGAVALPDGAKTRKATFSANALPCEDGLHVVVALAPDAKKGYLAVFEDRILVAHSGERADGYAFRDPGVVLSVGERTEGSGAAGTVSANPKYGQVAAGKDVTLTAKADKDSVFYRWEIDPASPADGKDLSDPTLKLHMDGGGDMRAKAVFVTKEEDAANIALSVNGAALSGSPTTNVFCGVAVNWPVAVTALSKTAVKVSGLPSGLKFTDKGVHKKGSKTEYDVLPNTIYGAPTAASKVDAKKGVVPSEVKITVTTAGKTTKTYAMSVTVDPLPAWAVGTFDGAEFGYRDGAVAVEDVSGLVYGLAVAANGKISGKVLRSDGTWTFSADSFASYDAGSGMYLAVVVAKNGKAAATNVLAVTSHKVDGADQGVVTVMGGGETVQMAWQSPWKAEPWKTTAKDFAKAPALAIGEVTLKFASSGAVTAAGKFVTGKDVVYSASCSSTLLPQGNNAYLAVLYFPPKKDAKGNVTFAGYSALVPLSWDAEAKAFSLVPEE